MITTAKRIVCPLDFSNESIVALAYAASCAARWGSTLWVVHVVQRDATDESDIRVHVAMRDLDLLRSTVQRLTRGTTTVVPSIRRGDVADEISGLAWEIGADLVVMATHGRSAWERCRDGSIVDEVACQSPCPVVTVKSNVGAGSDRIPRGVGVSGALCLN